MPRIRPSRAELTGFRRFALWVLLGAAPAWSAGSARADPAGPLAPAAPLAAAPLALDLSAIAREVNDTRALFDEKIALRPESAIELLHRAQIDFFEEDYPQAVSRLLDLTARADFQHSPDYGEALTWLGEALWQLGLRRAAAAELRLAIAQPALPSAYRSTLIRYLTLGATDEPLEALRNAWQRYQSTRPEGDLAPEDRDVRYLYAKALFAGGAHGEARSLFSAITEDDPHHLQAMYFLGVLLVSEEDLKGAREAFEEGLKAWQEPLPPPPAVPGSAPAKPAKASKSKEKPKEPAYWDVEPGGGPPLTADEVEPVDPESVLDETKQLRARMGQVFHLALARLDATRGNLEKAIGHYRQVPPGSPDHPAAMQELVWALYRRGEFGWAARIVDQLLSGRGDDRTAAELFIWKAHLLALDADYEGSRKNYEALETSLNRRREELEGDLSRDTRLFPDPVLAWSEPATAQRARALEATLVEEEEELAEAHELKASLRALLDSSELLPGVRLGKLAAARLDRRVAEFDTRLVVVLGQPPGPAQDAALGAPVDTLQTGRARLGQRLDRLRTALDEAERSWRLRIAQVLGEERPNLTNEGVALDAETASARRLGMDMAEGARQRLLDYAADAHFRQIDIAWWRVDEMRRRIKKAREEQREVLRPMREEVEDFRRERKWDPIPDFEEPDEAR